jgi:hypothetical protein
MDSEKEEQEVTTRPRRLAVRWRRASPAPVCPRGSRDTVVGMSFSEATRV